MARGLVTGEGGHLCLLLSAFSPWALSLPDHPGCQVQSTLNHVKYVGATFRRSGGPGDVPEGAGLCTANTCTHFYKGTLYTPAHELSFCPSASGSRGLTVLPAPSGSGTLPCRASADQTLSQPRPQQTACVLNHGPCRRICNIIRALAGPALPTTLQLPGGPRLSVLPGPSVGPCTRTARQRPFLIATMTVV